jgi:hypothetical protein
MAERRVKDMHYYARISCVINWYAEHRFVTLPKDRACDKHLKAWQYLQVSVTLITFYLLLDIYCVDTNVLFVYVGASQVLPLQDTLLQGDGQLVDLEGVQGTTQGGIG